MFLVQKSKDKNEKLDHWWKFIFGAITGREDNEKIRVHCQLITKIIAAMENSGLYEKFDPSIPWKQTLIFKNI